MAPPADYSGLRALALSSANEEEAVTVNHRDLITKVLSRYPHKWYVGYAQVSRPDSHTDIIYLESGRYYVS